jgi:cytochrome c peroxidase
MHDGSLLSLDEVIDHYARGGRHGGRADRAGTTQADGRHHSRQDRRIRPFSLSNTERADLIAFLDSLTDREFVDDARFR